jgi:predicted DNA-binding protein YlxM (UPF0122 family)
MRANLSVNVYYLYEFLRKRGGNVSDYELVKAFKNATSDEIFQAKCLLKDYEKKHPLLADRKCSTKRKNHIKHSTESRNQEISKLL